MKFAKKTGIHRLLPLNWINDLEKLLLIVFGPSIKVKVDAYKKYLSERNPDYLKWSINQIINWKQLKYEDKIIHIHGEKDKVFPVKYLKKNKNFIIVKNGTHATILRDHKWFSRNLPKIINMN
jgi:hypothetical protein